MLAKGPYGQWRDVDRLRRQTLWWRLAILYVVFLAYLAAHFGLFIALVHNARMAFSENHIFAYHALPFCLWVLSTVALVWTGESDLPTAAAILASHGIYTIVFLDLWSLTEGSYFMEVLRHITKNAGYPLAGDYSSLEKIADRKKAARLEALVDLGLLHQVGEKYALTRSGEAIAHVLWAIRWMANHKHIG